MYSCQVAIEDTGNSPAKGRLERRFIIEKALTLAHDEGLAAVTVRRLAQTLGVTPMALYWHFPSKEALFAGMADAIYAAIDLSRNENAPWPVQLRALLESLIHALRAHPSVGTLFSTRLTSPDETFSEISLKGIETLLELLRRAGFSPAEATQVARHILDTVTGLVAVAEQTRLGREQADAARERTRAFLAALPPTSYPRLVETALPLSTVDDPERYYRFGLELLLAGVETMAARVRPNGS